MPNFSDNENDFAPGGLGGSKGFKHYLRKASIANKITPETKAYMQRKAGSATNKLMRSKVLADYGLNIADPTSGRRYR